MIFNITIPAKATQGIILSIGNCFRVREISEHLEIYIEGKRLDKFFVTSGMIYQTKVDCHITIDNPTKEPQKIVYITGSEDLMRMHAEDDILLKQTMNRYSLDFKFIREGINVEGKALVDATTMDKAIVKFSNEFSGVEVVTVTLWDKNVKPL